MTEARLKVGVLETGRPPEELADGFGDYPGMVEDWLAPLEAEFEAYAVLDNAFPEGPAACDLWVITGSRFAAYEDHPWIAPLEGFIRACREAARPMVGICFGHQMIAQALGGVVRKSERGWGLGVHDYEVTRWPEALGPAPEGLHIQAYHQDQVEVVPEGAEVVATSAFCPNAALWYPGFALTVQGHPEFAKDYVSALLESRRGTVLADTDVDPAQASMAKPTNRDALAGVIRDSLAREAARRGTEGDQ